jgi:hypothetical protein
MHLTLICIEFHYDLIWFEFFLITLYFLQSILIKSYVFSWSTLSPLNKFNQIHHRTLYLLISWSLRKKRRKFLNFSQFVFVHIGAAQGWNENPRLLYKKQNVNLSSFIYSITYLLQFFFIANLRLCFRNFLRCFYLSFFFIKFTISLQEAGQLTHSFV